MKKYGYIFVILGIVAFLVILFILSFGIKKPPAKGIYILSFYDPNNNLLKTTDVNEGNYMLTEVGEVDGYLFNGWIYNGKRVTVVNVKEDMTFVGDFIKNNVPTYTMSFVSNGGSRVNSFMLARGERFIPPANPKKDGYLFDCWMTKDGSKIENDWIPEEDTRLYANWIVAPEGVTEDDVISKIILSEKTVTLPVGSTHGLKVSFEPSNPYDKNIKWGTTNSSVAVVSNGVIKAISPGKATIVVESTNGVRAGCEVIVTEKPVEVTNIIVNSSLVVELGYKKKIQYTIEPENAKTDALIWVSKNPQIVSVDANGYVEGKAIGSTTIGVKSTSGVSKTISVTIVNPANPITNITLNHQKIDLYANQSATLVATIYPAESTNKDIFWKSSNPNVAVIDVNGKITGLTQGQTTITATTANGKTASCIVTVKIVPVTNIDIEQKNITMKVDQTYKLSVIYTPSNTTQQKIVWSSTNENAVIVSKDGTIKAVGTGVAKINAKAENGRIVTVTVTVQSKYS